MYRVFLYIILQVRRHQAFLEQQQHYNTLLLGMTHKHRKLFLLQLQRIVEQLPLQLQWMILSCTPGAHLFSLIFG